MCGELRLGEAALNLGQLGVLPLKNTSLKPSKILTSLSSFQSVQKNPLRFKLGTTKPESLFCSNFRTVYILIFSRMKLLLLLFFILRKAHRSGVEGKTAAVQLQRSWIQIRYNQTRVAFLQQFPYGVYFNLIENEIIIFAVFNTSQSPKKWSKR